MDLLNYAKESWNKSDQLDQSDQSNQFINLISSNIFTLSQTFKLEKYIYVLDNIHILSFELRSNLESKSLEFNYEGTKFKAANINDSKEIMKFFNFLNPIIIGLLVDYEILSSKLYLEPSYETISYLYLVSRSRSKSSSDYTLTIKISENMYTINSNNKTKYCYSDINKLLANPLLKPYKKWNCFLCS